MRRLATLALALGLAGCGLTQSRTVVLEKQQDEASAERFCEERGMDAYAVKDPETGGDTYQCL